MSREAASREILTASTTAGISNGPKYFITCTLTKLKCSMIVRFLIDLLFVSEAQCQVGKHLIVGLCHSDFIRLNSSVQYQLHTLIPYD